MRSECVMKRRKTYIIGLLAICIVGMNILYSVVNAPLDQKGPIDLGSTYNINSMVNL
jgi:hypothetical protein